MEYWIYIFLQVIFYSSIYFIWWQRKNNKKNSKSKSLIRGAIAIIIFSFAVGTFNLIPTTPAEIGAIIISIIILRKFILQYC